MIAIFSNIIMSCRGRSFTKPLFLRTLESLSNAPPLKTVLARQRKRFSKAVTLEKRKRFSKAVTLENPKTAKRTYFHQSSPVCLSIYRASSILLEIFKNILSGWYVNH
jgi:hypothetical protein